MLKLITLFGVLLVASPGENKGATENTDPEIIDGINGTIYQEVISFYKKLSDNSPNIQRFEFGQTDSGLLLHLVTFNPDKEFDFSIVQNEKAIILINNGIHSGEPDGIEATMRFFKDIATGKIQPPKKTVITAIPIYNIGGALNRNSTTRANQNGPEEHGFRGNTRNYDFRRKN